MLATQRQELILGRVAGAGAVRVADLVAELDVSDMTIRRDIAELARRGLVRRVHGGAVDARQAAHEPGFRAKLSRSEAEKTAIARAALDLIHPGSAIGLSAGTTTHLLAQLIATSTIRPLTVVTNSLPAADTLHRADDPALTVVLTGGTPTPSDALVGPLSTQALRGLHLDMVFLGVHGMDVDAGLTTPNLLEAETDRAMVAAGDQLVVLADHTKWGETGLSRIAELTDVTVLVTDAVPDGVDLPDLDLLLAPTPGA
ncbi:DeoR/GlpR family DNA-binding transcription regulator [Isoptericola sp. b441]|uniref:DeoR/GlpR family DNA-binding transcription regulator n=1 Tax=Actinotalea lenta TaxID=3064654 RepID=A0ABT9D5M6_9CELL|nr:DeoR/GlpR family DNA-binding transcription regulator [Isoptericola sp. b441]MDO8105591.1 DeoR/GlpR family DNA-binding transcription regulator [Isoptericola sp. b441]